MRRTQTSFVGTTLLICLGFVLAGQTSFAQSRVGGVSSGLNGQVRDVCGRVIPGAAVRLDNQSGAAFSVVTGDGGRYEFHDVPSTGGSWVLTVELLGFEKARQEDIRLKDGAPLEHNIRLLPDLRLKESLSVEGHSEPRFRKYSAIGIVSDPNGIPVSGATVTFRASGPAAGNPAIDRCTTDERGRYYVSQCWRPQLAGFSPLKFKV
jgi:carboxypeptidase family protein